MTASDPSTPLCVHEKTFIGSFKEIETFECSSS